MHASALRYSICILVKLQTHIYGLRTDLGVIEPSETRRCIRQEEVSTEDSHLVSKLHIVTLRTFSELETREIDDSLVDQACGVDHLGDLSERPLAEIIIITLSSMITDQH